MASKAANRRRGRANAQLKNPVNPWLLLAALLAILLIAFGLTAPLLPANPLNAYPALVFNETLGRVALPAMAILLVLSVAGVISVARNRQIVTSLQISLVICLVLAMAGLESSLALASGSSATGGGIIGSWLAQLAAGPLPPAAAAAAYALLALSLAAWSLASSEMARTQLGRLGAAGFTAGRVTERGLAVLGRWLGEKFESELDETVAEEPEAVTAKSIQPGEAYADPDGEIELLIKHPASPIESSSVVRLAELEEPAHAAGWRLPPTSLFDTPIQRERVSHEEITENAAIIERTLANFRVNVRVVEAIPGPVVTQYCISPAAGVRVTHITRHNDDLALALSARSVRTESPIPGRPYVGLEIPNRDPSVVTIRELLESNEFQTSSDPLTLVLGKDVADHSQVRSLARMPHLLIAGSTGAGKSVFINTLLLSLLCQYTPDELRIVLIDPKMVEMVPYNAVPHLLMPVVSTPSEAVPVLAWVQQEMTQRYRVLRDSGRRNVAAYNATADLAPDDRLPYLVVVVDEMADLMMTAPVEIEHSICRLAQMARAVGIHLVIATQRPSVDVITGLIKANFPSRVAFMVSSQVDSRTILDQAGAEKLMGRGDMLFTSAEHAKCVRVQGAFASDEEIAEVVKFWAGQGAGDHISEAEIADAAPAPSGQAEPETIFTEAVNIVTQFNYASPALLQRELKLNAAKAAELIQSLEEAGVVGPLEGEGVSRPFLGTGQSGQPTKSAVLTIEV